MIARLLLALILILSTVAIETAQAQSQSQSPFGFFRRQPKQQKPPAKKPPPAQAVPATPAPPGAVPFGNESSVPSGNAGAASAKVPTNTPPPPYEKDVRRVSEILGALHYLRPLCGADDGAVWRDKMSALIEAEGGPPDRRERLAGAFNEGYSGYQLTYRTCTPSADLAVRRYLAEGAKLTREIATRHSN
jgi:uncharacterized protein (TIGR02301 family)